MAFATPYHCASATRVEFKGRYLQGVTAADSYLPDFQRLSSRKCCSKRESEIPNYPLELF